MAHFNFLTLALLLLHVPGASAIRGRSPIATAARQDVPEAVQKNDKDQGDQNENENDSGNGNGNLNNQPTLSGLTLGEVWDFVANSDGTSPSGVCETREYVDVIIIGAGMAGVSAASTLNATDPSLSYVVLESQNRVGGRIRSVDFGIPTNSWKIEDGANWVLDFDGNPTQEMAEAIQLQAPVNDYSNVQAYYEDVSDKEKKEKEELFF